MSGRNDKTGQNRRDRRGQGDTSPQAARSQRASTRTNTRTKCPSPARLWRNIRRTWRKAGLRQRTVMALTGAVAIVVVMALVMGLVRFTQWRGEVRAAERAQLTMQADYDFNPGDIISDAQFFNGSAMSQAEVQAFLEEQGGALASMTFDTTDESGEGLCQDYVGVKGESAAVIIDQSARACGISQKVLLTMLQKEQHLVTATSPDAFQLKSAMGLSCPDDARCDPAYAGFFRQVYGAAKRFRYYEAHQDRYSYHEGQLNFVPYSPDAGCGGTEVWIANKATALLYIYTPYQPNTAALEAGEGSGDACSSYGNRNFALIYAGWFGDPRR